MCTHNLSRNTDQRSDFGGGEFSDFVPGWDVYEGHVEFFAARLAFFRIRICGDIVGYGSTQIRIYPVVFFDDCGRQVLVVLLDVLETDF